jgi:peptidoglycan/LPS O-acetylase OafA/YrhL
VRGKWILRTVLVLVCVAVIVIPAFSVGTGTEFLIWLAAVVGVVGVSVLIHRLVERRTRES